MMIAVFLLNLVLALTWSGLQGELNTSNFAVGFLVSAVVIYIFRQMFFRPLYFRKSALGVKLLLIFLKELTLANLAVLKIVMGRKIQVRSGVIAVPTELKQDLALTLLANMITLTPGTLTLDIAADRRCLFVHTLNLDDPEEIKGTILTAFEQPLQELSR